jgi:hypothetical protein
MHHGRKAFNCVQNSIFFLSQLQDHQIKSGCLKTWPWSRDIKISANDNIFIYASRALNKTGQKYSQLEKELYAIIYGCKHFHHFIYGKKGNVTTDHH